MKLLPGDPVSLSYTRTTAYMVISGDDPLTSQENKANLHHVVDRSGWTHRHWGRPACGLPPAQDVRQHTSCVTSASKTWQGVTSANVLEHPQCYPPSLTFSFSRPKGFPLRPDSLPKLKRHRHLCVPKRPLSGGTNLGESTFILPSAVELSPSRFSICPLSSSELSCSPSVRDVHSKPCLPDQVRG